MLRYAITDRQRASPGAERQPANPHHLLPQRCAELARAGVDFILIREKDLPAAQLAALSRSILASVRQTAAPTRVLIAQRLDVALAVQADGVHLSSAPGELLPEQVRRLMPHAFVTVSCHTLEDIRRARDQGASAALLAPIFGKVVDGREVTPALGLDALHDACSTAGAMPVFALGNVTLLNAPACLAAGAAGIAGIRIFFPDPPNPTPPTV